jgi:signal transduction histidine kinase
MTLRSRLFALVGAAVVVAVVLVTLTVTDGARRAFAAVDAQRNAAVVAQFRRDLANEGTRVVSALERVAASASISRLRGQMAAPDADLAGYVQEAAPLAAAHGLEFLDIVAADGTIVSSAHWPAAFGQRNEWAVHRPPLYGASGDFLQVVDLPQGRALGLVAVYAVEAGGGRFYLAGGRRLDRAFLQSLAAPPGMPVLLYGSLDPAASRPALVAASGDETGSADLDALVTRVRGQGSDVTAAVSQEVGEAIAHAIRLPARDGSVGAVLVVLGSGEQLAALVRRIRWSGFVFGALGIAVGFGLSYLVAARVTRPVEQLADTARRVADGDWSAEVGGVRASGEIGVLADAFGTMTRQLADQRERLVQAERVAAWRELARRLAHELKNPLFPLRITLDNLRRARPLPPAEFDEVFEESVQTLTVGLGNLNTVVGRFSDFARMPAPHVAELDPNALVRDVVALFRAQLDDPSRPIAVSLDLDREAVRIRADADQLGRALQNLLLNAIDAMPAGGTLTIRSRRSGSAFRLDVGDTGQGIEADEQARLFTPYYTTKQHGTGLGLAIVQSVVADHGGKISVESAVGRGTVFHIELPA